MKITRALLSALALLALLAVPAFAQSGSFTVTINCGAPESITVDNTTDGTLVLEGVNSSENQEGDPEIDLGGREVAAGASVTINFGDVSGTGNIFNNDLDETATVMVSGAQYKLLCEMGGTVTETFQIGGVTPEPTPEVRATEVTEARPEATPVMPTGPGKNGAGGMAPTPFPVGQALAGASVLIAAAYAGLRRR